MSRCRSSIIIFIKKALRADFGESIYYGLPVSEIVWQRLPATLMLVGTAKLLSLLFGISAGVLAARRRGSYSNNFLRWFSFLGLSMPNFWIAMLFILIFSVKLKILPTGGYGTFWHLLMPAFSLGWYFSAGYTRITESSLLQVLNSEYIKLCRVKGLSELSVVAKHALKNALIPGGHPGRDEYRDHDFERRGHGDGFCLAGVGTPHVPWSHLPRF